MARAYSLRIHQAAQNENYGDLTVSQLGNQDLKVGDIVEVSKEDYDKHAGPILLKISNVSDMEYKKGDTVSLLDTICNNPHFGFKTFNPVYLKRVDPKPVDLVVMVCKDTYLSRSDMWRLKQSMEGTCIYKDKKITFLNQKMPITVSEIWLNGEMLTCGYFGQSTKISFRSSTAAVHLFIQMSAEMWQYDSYGDLYFEKAVSGFLNDLFQYWKKSECCHDVTIVMFSRTFYEAQSEDQFPEFMKAGLLRDVHGRFYEDFYRVVIQNERYDEWKNTMKKLKKLFINYRRKVLREEEREKDSAIPKAYNSSAMQGNFLEVLNMSLNVYEKYYLDRNFDRLGKSAMIITPGPGVFEVDKELTTITKLRTINTGCAADLICMGEQPLHAVPLFKIIHYRNGVQCETLYKIARNWINHSFYTSQSQLRSTSSSQFIPRIKLPPKKSDQVISEENKYRHQYFTDISESEESAEDSDYDYDRHDKDIFKQHQMRSRCRSLAGMKRGLCRQPRQRNLSEDCMADREVAISASADQKKTSAGSLPVGQICSIVAPEVQKDHRPTVSRDSEDSEDDEHLTIMGSSIERTDQSLLNVMTRLNAPIDPFVPNSIRQNMTANRRRWAHAFPLDQNGVEILPHHYIDTLRIPISSHKLVTSGNSRMRLSKKYSVDMRPVRSSSTVSFESTKFDSPDSADESIMMSPTTHRFGSIILDSIFPRNDSYIEGHLRSGGTEDSDFSPMLKTGVDWRSLTTPAVLPLTTDYYPSDKQFEQYEESVYTVCTSYDTPQTYDEFVKELVSIRLALGYQLIMKEDQLKELETPSNTLSAVNKRHRPPKKEVIYRLSIGRIFHQVSVLDDAVTVTVYKKKNSSKPREKHYSYQFLNPDGDGYTVSFTSFAVEQLENYNWNLLDNYVYNHDESDNIVNPETMKYWRSRYCLLPSNQTVKFIYEKVKQGKTATDNEIFSMTPDDEFPKYNDSFNKFLELVNAVKRQGKHKPPGKKESRSPVVDDGRTTSSDKPFDLNKIDCKKLIELMKDQSSGLPFMDHKTSRLPIDTFIAYDALLWIVNNVRYVHNIKEALEILKKLKEEKLIQPVTRENGDILGFHLYYLASAKSSWPIIQQPGLADDLTFQKEWVEVTLPTASPDTLTTADTGKPVYKRSDIDTHLYGDVKSRSELKRIEWLKFKYQNFYHPCCAFDFEIDWIAATGVLTFEMINSWRRKVTNLGFHLLPIPIDPFALPTEKNSDPLRGPIFVKLHADCLNHPSVNDLAEFMEYVIKRFGFIPIGYDTTSILNRTTQYIHCSGGFFVLIQREEENKKAGFHWSWNFMMTKQWWSASSGDEIFEDCMLADFRMLTENRNGRLEKIWIEWNDSK